MCVLYIDVARLLTCRGEYLDNLSGHVAQHIHNNNSEYRCLCV